MLLESVKVGDRLEIVLKREKNLGKSYVSQVEEIRDGNNVVVHIPISYGQLVKLPITDNYSVLFFTEKGMISFDAGVVECFEEDGFNLMKLKILSSGERIQRREFFRFNCILPFKFNLMDDEQLNDDMQSENEMGEGIIKDLGGGGIRFVSNEDMEEGDMINCVILLENELLILLGKVLHKQHFPKSNYKYQYRVQFTDVMQTDQEAIVQFIFNEQRKIIRKSRTDILEMG